MPKTAGEGLSLIRSVSSARRGVRREKSLRHVRPCACKGFLFGIDHFKKEVQLK